MSRSFIRGEITGADIQGTLQKLTEADVTLYDTQFQDDLTVLITCEPGDFRKVQSICGKRGDRVTILHRQGLYWNLRAIMGRPVLVAGFALILFLSLFLPSRVLFVEVEGEENIPPRKILETASNCGIRFGASRRSVRSEKMKNALLEAMPELQWAGVNTKGCTAVITVRERTTISQSGEVRELSHIVALTDARITSCTATRGTLLCTPGQAVVAGQILISGFTDTGLTIRADRAEGEVYGQTMRNFRGISLSQWHSVVKTGTQMKKISLLIGKKRINLWKDSGIWDATCDRMYEEYYITLPGGYRLPLALAVERFSVRDLTPQEFPQIDAEALLLEFAESSLKQTMVAGSINSRRVSVTPEPGIWILTGEYRCTEMIGIRQRFQIGEKNG